MKLLIVEDNLEMRELIKFVVGDLADAVAECGDGGEAVAAYAAERPDWVLMDLEMPCVGGLAATRRLRAAWPEARVVIVTQYDDDYYRAAARAAGACAYVTKEDLLPLRQLLLRRGNA
jgi:CheY-like chemotaxis protein